MQPPQQHSPLEQHDESYFASFTDMLIGVIFIFIILLMIYANNYQQAAESVRKQSGADLVARLNQERQKALDRARDNDIRKTELDIFYNSRAKILQEIERSL